MTDRMARAEDYVFGLMSEEERVRAERDMEVDGEFRECVMRLGEQLRRLRAPNTPVEISDDAWRDITRRIAAMPQMTGAATSARMAGAGLQLPGASRSGFLKVKRPFAQQFGGWKGTVMALALAAALGVGYYVGRASAPLPSPETVALLNDGDGSPAALVEAWHDRSLRLLPFVAIEAPAGKVLQFWAGGQPVGVLPRATEGVVRGPHLPLPRVGERYEITFEDAPGVSAGQRPGPIILGGEATAAPR